MNNPGNIGIVNPRNKKVWLFTFGCKLNFSETATISRKLKSEGFDIVAEPENADYAVINTCSVTENANRDCKKLLKNISKKNKNIQALVIGCYAQLKPQEIIQMPNVVGVLGTNDKFNTPQILKKLQENPETIHCSEIDNSRFNISYSVNERSRIFFKIQDGCSYKCSFCTIPIARGKSRSAKPGEILNNLQELLKNNPKEIILTGINLGDYKYENLDFADIVKLMLDTFPELPRIRISSVEPNLFSDKLINVIKESQGKIVPHFHIPLQSGSDEILKKMRRRYLTKLYEERIEKILETLPEANIGVDVIVGFPTETKEDFQATYDFLENLPVGYLHVFSYSPRENTYALSLKPHVPEAEKKRRSAILRELSDKKKAQYASRFIGETREAVFEATPKGEFLLGYTDNYLRVKIPYEEALKNSLKKVRLVSLNSDLTLNAEIC